MFSKMKPNFDTILYLIIENNVISTTNTGDVLGGCGPSEVLQFEIKPYTSIWSHLVHYFLHYYLNYCKHDTSLIF